jgi:hypothetical protein
VIWESSLQSDEGPPVAPSRNDYFQCEVI